MVSSFFSKPCARLRYYYDVEATDFDHDPLTYSLVTSPEGMTINPSSGLITWIPASSQIENKTVKVQVADGRGGIDTQQFTIVVKEGNTPPEITSVPPTKALVGALYTYHVLAHDPDNDPLAFSLPVGSGNAEVNSGTGQLTWTPTAAETGSKTLTIRVTGTFGVYDEQTFTITVVTENAPPIFTSTPITTAAEGEPYTYQAQAADPNNDPLIFWLAQGPVGMTITAEGLVTFTPAYDQAGTHAVSLAVTDGIASATQDYTLIIKNENAKPVIQSTPPPTVSKGTTYVYQAHAIDPDSDPLSYNLLSAPSGMTINPTTGRITWPDDGNRLNHEVVVLKVTDPSNASDHQTWKIAVTKDTTLPTVILSYSPANPAVGSAITFTVDPQDDVGIDEERVWLKVDGVYLPLENGQATCPALKAGALNALATAYDREGNYAEDGKQIPVSISGADTIKPVAYITAPLEDTTVFSPVTLTGTATDANFAYYTLSYRDTNESDFIEYYRGYSPITNSDLGVFDPTQRENGHYVIRLTVYDQCGNQSNDDLRVLVDGNMKVGIFTLSFSDMVIPLPGIELEVTRTHDSRIKTKEDFGIGWSLSLKQSVKLTENRIPGKDWQIVCTKELLGGCIEWGLDPSKEHVVSIHLPGAPKQEFDVKAVTTYADEMGIAQGYFTFTPRPGTYATLEPLDNVSFDFFLEGALYLDLEDLEPVNPNRYKLTLPDGAVYIYDQAQGGVTKIIDPNGNTVDIYPDKVIHSAGDEITFIRDAEGRITSIVDADGKTVAYAYDGHGNLQSVTDPLSYETRFKYGPNHYLMEILDPRGVRAIRTEYGDQGKMIRQINPDGQVMEFNHDIGTQQEIVTDFEGRTTRFTYDQRGNILNKIDHAGSAWSYTYDSKDNLLSTGNPDGTTKHSTWDTHGNELTATDELNRTTTRTYNAQDKLLTQTDPLGRTIAYQYDAKGNLLRETGPDGAIILQRTYNPQGQVLTETNALNQVTRYFYTLGGSLSAEQDPLGRTRNFSYNRDGNLLWETDAKGNKTSYTYDAKGNQLTATDAGGNITVNTYTCFGTIATATDANGNITVHEYNRFGQPSRIINSDGTFTQKTYDQQGNVKILTDEAGRVTTFEYDHENRITRTIFNDGSFTRTEYDAQGRMTASIDAKSSRTEYEYNAVGANTLVRDALNNATAYEYDAGNRKTAMKDALGHRIEYQYDAYDRLVKTIFPDGTFSAITYDDAGRKTTETDQAGKITRFEYDVVGNLVKVIDAMLFETVYGYDENNNRIGQKDANGHTTAMAYDTNNRLIAKTFPDGDQETFVYDANGNMLQKSTDNGPRTFYEYDERNREILLTYEDSGHTVTTAYTADGKPETVTDYRGETAYDYDIRGRQLRVNNPDGTYLESRYDSQGNRTHQITPFGTTIYSYDALNRMKTVTSPDNEVTEYFYNAVGNRSAQDNPNGTKVGYTFDNLNRLTNVTNFDPQNSVISSYTYELNNAGIRTAVIEHDGARVEYGYDNLYRLVSETRGPVRVHGLHFILGTWVTLFYDYRSCWYPVYNILDPIDLLKEPANKNIIKIYVMYTIFYLFKTDIIFHQCLAHIDPEMLPSDPSVPAYSSYFKL